jgi:hypothetical protein
MALTNKVVTITASTAVCPSITLMRQADGSFIADAAVQITLSDGQVLNGSVSLPLTTAGQLTATGNLENALLRAWRLARGLET